MTTTTPAALTLDRQCSYNATSPRRCPRPAVSFNRTYGYCTDHETFTTDKFLAIIREGRAAMLDGRNVRVTPMYGEGIGMSGTLIVSADSPSPCVQFRTVMGDVHDLIAYEGDTCESAQLAPIQLSIYDPSSRPAAVFVNPLHY